MAGLGGRCFGGKVQARWCAGDGLVFAQPPPLSRQGGGFGPPAFAYLRLRRRGRAFACNAFGRGGRFARRFSCLRTSLPSRGTFRAWAGPCCLLLLAGFPCTCARFRLPRRGTLGAAGALASAFSGACLRSPFCHHRSPFTPPANTRGILDSLPI